MTDRPTPGELESFILLNRMCQEEFGRDFVSLFVALQTGEIEVDEFSTMLETLRARFRKGKGRAH